MRRALIIAALLLAACASDRPSPIAAPIAPPSPTPPPSLEKIAEGVWSHKSYKDLPGLGPVLSRGLVIDTGAGVFLVDSAWDDAATETLLALIRSETGQTPQEAVFTHAHDDKMGGAKALADAGVKTFALDIANEDAPARGLHPASVAYASPFGEATHWSALERPGGRRIDGADVIVFYPGPGHTRDNLVVYFPKAKVLFGGCLVRPAGGKGLGNTADADVSAWAQSVRAVAARFPEATIVVPSHGDPGGRELLDHTIALAGAAHAR